MDPFEFSALKPGDLVEVRFGLRYETARVMATFISDEAVQPGTAVVKTVVSAFEFTTRIEQVRALMPEER